MKNPKNTKRPVLRGVPRFLIYFVMQIFFITLAFPRIFLALGFLLLIASMEGFSWLKYFRRFYGLLFMIILPALLGFPWQKDGLLTLWAPGLLKSTKLLCIFASAIWLSFYMSPVDIRDVFAFLLRPFGAKLASKFSRALSLGLAFIPWTMDELKKTDEALRLRGSVPQKNIVKHIFALALPLLSHTLQKAKLASDAIALRDPAFMEETPDQA